MFTAKRCGKIAVKKRKTYYDRHLEKLAVNPKDKRRAVKSGKPAVDICCKQAVR